MLRVEYRQQWSHSGSRQSASRLAELEKILADFEKEVEKDAIIVEKEVVKEAFRPKLFADMLLVFWMLGCSVCFLSYS